MSQLTLRLIASRPGQAKLRAMNLMETDESRLKRGLRDPWHALRVAWALLRGQAVKTVYPLVGIRFSAGRNFRLVGKLQCRGPGRVVFGDNVIVDSLVTPWTHSPEAVISIGDNCYVNGTRFGCVSRITVGPRAILGNASIFDTNYHSTSVHRHSADAPVTVSPVHIAPNVWIGAAAGILPGTQIGENSVVGYGAVCKGEFPANVIIAGNPASIVASVPDAPASSFENLAT